MIDVWLVNFEINCCKGNLLKKDFKLEYKIIHIFVENFFMISIYQLKPKFQKLLEPVLVFLYHIKVTANQITIVAIVLSFIIGVSFWLSDTYSFLFLVLPIGLFIRMALNALDGLMARRYNQQSKKGELLNEIGDIVSDVFIFLPLIKFEKHILFFVVCFIALSIINEYAGIMGKVLKNDRRYDGPMGKSDRALLIGLYGILSFFGVNFSNYSIYFFSIIIILLFISTYTRLKKAL